MINIIEIHLDFIDKEIDKYYERFNFYPYVICNQETLNAMANVDKNNTPRNVNAILKARGTVQTYKTCTVLIDNTMQFGMIDIR